MPKLRKKSVLKRKDESELLMREERQKATTGRFNIQPEDNGGSDSGLQWTDKIRILKRRERLEKEMYMTADRTDTSTVTEQTGAEEEMNLVKNNYTQ